ncbi:molybdopterin molybdotransferase MoeA [Bordetella trematum]|uniref:molybdopterin molybdotransferase MoeA n=1 Tax=Bordetella trematum TaxID=123899 RepID=UPI0015C579A6|nr:gephyrin-like molybdotransferase Glp [Bordetella trematum]
MMEFDQAQAQLAEAAGALTRRETLPLAQLAGRVLAQDLQAALDLPPADNSAMDGYALRAADYAAGRKLPLMAERIYAGLAPQPLSPGHAARLFTGSLMPDGADTVIMQEDAHEADGSVTFLQAPTPGQHIRRRGEDTRAGEPLIAAGTVLQAAHIALLASQGIAQAQVYGRLRVGILTTGDELVAPGQPRALQQIYNSNGAMLAAMAAGMGAEVPLVLHALDDEASLTQAFEQLLQACDLVLSVGGVSVGERDLVKPVLESMGASLVLWKVRMKPGKPVALAQACGKPLVCLPGNPVSAFSVFTVLVSPLVRRMQGRRDIFPATPLVTLRTERTRRDGREEFLRVQYRAGDFPELHPYRNQSSGVMSSLPWADGLARLPYDTDIPDGTPVRYYDYRLWQR